MSGDKTTIGVTAENHGALQRLVAEGQFETEIAAAKFAMAYAIEQGVEPGRTKGADTKWNVGTVDPNGDIGAAIRALYPSVTEVYRLIEYLMNQGLQSLARESASPPDVYGALFD